MSNTDNSIDVSTLRSILENLVTEPEDIQIRREVDEQGVLLSIIVNAKDMGIIIGRSGIMANSIKVLMRAIGKANKMNVRVEFLEPDGTRRMASSTTQHLDESGMDQNLPEFAIN